LVQGLQFDRYGYKPPLQHVLDWLAAPEFGKFLTEATQVSEAAKALCAEDLRIASSRPPHSAPPTLAVGGSSATTSAVAAAAAAAAAKRLHRRRDFYEDDEEEEYCDLGAAVKVATKQPSCTIESEASTSKASAILKQPPLSQQTISPIADGKKKRFRLTSQTPSALDFEESF
jgi:hypothetical protein